MKGIIGRKLGMTQILDEHGNFIPVTVIEAGPVSVLQVKRKDTDGYDAVQVGFGTTKPKRVSKAVLGHCRKANREDTPPVKIAEIKLSDFEKYKCGDVISADIFNTGEFVDVIGRTKGRGFQGVVKRYNFAGGRFSHGGGWKRKPGSIGQCEFPGRVAKGRKLPGHMGNTRKTVQNLQIVKVIPEQNVILVKGAVPGCNNNFLIIKSAVKKQAIKK